MKSKIRFQEEAMRWFCALLLAACAAVPTLSAADAETPEKPAPEKPAADEKSDAEEKPAALTPEEFFEGGKTSYNNWIEFSAGGFLRDGNQAQFQQQHRTGDEPFGGIEDFHYQRDLNKNTLFTADGRALFDLHDYKLRLGVVNEKVGYLRFSFDEFRVWSNGDGGYYPPTDSFFTLSEDALTLDRGRITFEGGFTIEKKPKINFRYDHQFRDGEKGSTIWGITHPEIGVTRGLGPSFYDIDERSDTFQLNVAHRIKKTDFGLGLRYEFGELANALKITQSPGETVERKITDQQDSGYDLFNAHAFTETWIKNNVLFSSGFSFTDLDNDFSGSRIYGSDFDVNYVPTSADGAGFFGLDGGSRLREYVMNLNLLTIPLKHFTVVPSLRVQKEDVDADFTGLGTLGDRLATPFSGNTDRDLLDVRERLDLRYAGVTNWVFHARGEWTQGQGNLSEIGGFGPVGGVGVPAIQRETEDDRFFQKYSAGARWYPAKRITVDVGGYYKINDYGYDHSLDSTRNNSGNRYPAFLVMQNFETYDAHFGLTLRPRQNVTVGSRYEFQLSTINTAPDSTFGLGEAESSEMTSHIIAQNVSWSPWSRLHLQAGFNYVVSKTETPASDVTQAILDARNNYWTLTFNSSLVVDDKTDLNLAYFYYLADNYQDISSMSVPYGAGAEQHGVTATIVRRITESLRLKLKYGYFRYADETSGGYRNYDAHGLFSSLQYRF